MKYDFAAIEQKWQNIWEEKKPYAAVTGDTTKEKTFRNWAKAQLILMAIGIVLAVIFVIFASVLSADVINSYSSMIA